MIRKILLIFILLIISNYNFSQSRTARNYLDQTVGLTTFSTLLFNEVTTSPNRIVANQWIDSLRIRTDNWIKLLNNLKTFDNNIGLKIASLKYIKHLNLLSKKELPRIMSFIYNSNITDKEKLEYKKMYPKVTAETDKLYSNLAIETGKYKYVYNLKFPEEVNIEYPEEIHIDTAFKYNDYIVDRVDIIVELWDLAIDEESLPYALIWSKKLSIYSDKVISTLENLDNHEDDYGFKVSALKYIKYMSSISKNELPEFINIIRSDKTSIEAEKRADELIPILDYTRDSLFNEMELKQYQFADSANIDIKGRDYSKTVKFTFDTKTEFANPTEYSDYVIGLADFLNIAWTVTIEEEDSLKAMAFNDSLYQASVRVINSLEKIDIFKEYDDFRKAAISYANHYSEVTQKELREFLMIIRSQTMSPTNEKIAENMIPILDDVREDLYFMVSRTKATFLAKRGIFSQWYPSREWKKNPNLKYKEKSIFNSASEYNDYIIEIVFTVCDAGWQALNMNLGKKALIWSDSLKIQSKMVLESLQKLEPYENNDEYRQAAINYIQHVYNASIKEIPDFIRLNLLKKRNESENSKLEKIRPKIEDDTYKIFDDLRKKQIDFANKYEFEVKF